MDMELDTGAAVSMLPEELLKHKFPNTNLQPSSLTLRIYTGEVLETLGELPVCVQYNEQSVSDLILIVVKGCLFGRNWLQNYWINILKFLLKVWEQSVLSKRS